MLFSHGKHKETSDVDGQNPAAVGMWFICRETSGRVLLLKMVMDFTLERSNGFLNRW